MASAYDVAFKYEILNEVIASIDGFVFRNYRKKMPKNVKPLIDEVHEIYRRLPLENNLDVLETYDKRLMEIRDFVYANSPQTHK